MIHVYVLYSATYVWSAQEASTSSWRLRNGLVKRLGNKICIKSIRPLWIWCTSCWSRNVGQNKKISCRYTNEISEHTYWHFWPHCTKFGRDCLAPHDTLVPIKFTVQFWSIHHCVTFFICLTNLQNPLKLRQDYWCCQPKLTVMCELIEIVQYCLLHLTHPIPFLDTVVEFIFKLV